MILPLLIILLTMLAWLLYLVDPSAATAGLFLFRLQEYEARGSLLLLLTYLSIPCLIWLILACAFKGFGSLVRTVTRRHHQHRYQDIAKAMARGDWMAVNVMFDKEQSKKHHDNDAVFALGQIAIRWILSKDEQREELLAEAAEPPLQLTPREIQHLRILLLSRQDAASLTARQAVEEWLEQKPSPGAVPLGILEATMKIQPTERNRIKNWLDDYEENGVAEPQITERIRKTLGPLPW